MLLREKTRQLKTRFQEKMKNILESDGVQDELLSPNLHAPDIHGPAPEQSSSLSHLFPDASFESSGSGVSSWVKSEGWANLKGCLDSLDQMVAVGGVGPLKMVIEGLVDCIGIYENVAQGRQAYVNLRADLERTFKQLQNYLALSPTVAENISVACESIQKEIDYIKIQQAKPRIRRLQEAEDEEEKVLACYTRIRNQIQDLSLRLGVSTLTIVEQHAMDDCLRALTPSSSARYNSGNSLSLKRRPCTEGTRIGILAGMYEWVISRSTGNIYWMSGMAGTGKTTIAYSLCERLDAEPTCMLGASFFCSRSLPECRSVGRIIPSIAYQLSQYSQPFQHALYQAIKKTPDAHAGAPGMQFATLILKPLLDPKVKATFSKSTVVVIDALDECEDATTTRQMLGVLLTKSKNLPIKFVVSSRPEPTIRNQMEKNGTWVDARVVLHELESRQVQTDIRTYLIAELGPIEPSEIELDQLVARAGVLFIYAATVIRYVGHDDFGRNPRARLKAILSRNSQSVKVQTKDIDELYGIVLEAAFEDPSLSGEERDDMKLVLHTAICARQPLTVAGLNGLLKLDDVDRVNAALRPLWSVLHVMGANMTVTTLHASFPDYLLDSTRSGAWHCDAAAHHHHLARRCFDCISETKSQFNICNLESSYLTDTEVEDLDTRIKRFISPELRYACRYWPSHLDAVESRTAPDLVSALLHFLTTHLLLWMEVRNLTKTMPATLVDLTTAKRWATQRGVTREAIDLLGDAWRFASMFVSSPASQSTPHLYISMLPLLPSDSPIRKYYLGQLQGKSGVDGTALDLRKDELFAQWKFELSVECMACSPDGTRVAIGGTKRLPNENRLYVLDAFGGSLILDLSQTEKPTVSTIAFSPDSTRLASGTRDGVISVWDVTNGQPVLDSFRAHNRVMRAILFSNNGSYIISASADKTICVWDSFSGKPALTPFVGHTRSVTCIAISSNDELLVSGSSDRTIRIWDVKSGKSALDPIMGHDKAINAIAISSDDSYVVSGSDDGTIRVWDSRTGQMVLGPLQDEGYLVMSVSVSPDGATIASTTNIDSVQIWDTASGTIVSRLGPFSAENNGNKLVAHSPDGTRIIFTLYNGTIRVLNAQSAAIASEPLTGHTEPITSIDISPDGRHIVSGSSDTTLCIWDLTQGTLVRGPLNGHTAWINTVRFSEDGKCIVSCSGDPTIRQWHAYSGAAHSTPIHVASAEPQGFVSAAYSPNGIQIISLTYYGQLSVWNSSTGQSVLGPINAPQRSIGARADFSPDGTTAIAGYEDGSICAWSVESGQMTFTHQGDGRAILSSLAFSPDGVSYAQSIKGGKISLRNILTGEPISGDYQGHTDYAGCVQFSSNGTYLVSGSEDKSVYVWDAGTGLSISGPLRGHTNGVSCVTFSQDGNYVVSASNDMAIRVWNTQFNKLSSEVGEPSSKQIEWVLAEYGWVVDRQSRRLIWVPLDLRSSLMSSRNTALISRNGYLRLNFEEMFFGEAWVDCRRNV